MLGAAGAMVAFGGAASAEPKSAEHVRHEQLTGCVEVVSAQYHATMAAGNSVDETALSSSMRARLRARGAPKACQHGGSNC